MLKRFLLLCWHLVLLFSLSTAMIYHNLSIYLYQQARGQLHILFHTESIEAYQRKHTLTRQQSDNLQLIEKIRDFAEDSLDFVHTDSYSRIYDQGEKPILWAITASSDTALQAYYWHFPLLGAVTYKGFFEKERALLELNHLGTQSYDVEIRPVSAWSTLGWLNDPVLSRMLDLPKGALCNLLFHELFHSTYYAPGSVDENENLATFIGHKATLQFLQNDTLSLNQYLARRQDQQVLHNYLVKSSEQLRHFYTRHPVDRLLRIRQFVRIAQGIDSLPLSEPQRYARDKQDILQFKNAYFIGFNQYYKEQDSLETAFNKIYGGRLRNMVSYLKHKSGK